MSIYDDSGTTPNEEKWIDAEDAVRIGSAEEQRDATEEDTDVDRTMRERGRDVVADPGEDPGTSTGSGATSGGTT